MALPLSHLDILLGDISHVEQTCIIVVGLVKALTATNQRRLLLERTKYVNYATLMNSPGRVGPDADLSLGKSDRD
jgi:hypothetical protein